MENINNTFKGLLSRIKKTKQKENRILVISAFLKALAFVSIILLFASIIEFVANGDEIFRTIIFYTIILITTGLLLLFLFPYFSQLPGMKNHQKEEIVALRIGEKYPDIKDKLSNSIQLLNNKNNNYNTSQDMSIAAFTAINNVSADKDFDIIIDKKKYKRSILFIIITLFFTIILFSIFPNSLGSAFYRIANYNQSFLPSAPFSLSIEPKHADILRGQSITIKIKAFGTAPDEISLNIKEAQQENYDVYKVKKDSNNIYKYEINSIKNTLLFYAEAQWLNSAVKTEEAIINVIDLPIIRSFSGRIIYPSYTGLSPKSFNEQSGDISALKGSIIELNILASKELSSAKILFQNRVNQTFTGDSNIHNIDTSIYNMAMNGRKANGSIKVTNNGFYQVNIYDKDKKTNIDPIKYTIISQNDEYPSISLIEPSNDVEITEQSVLATKIAISDDYGFSGLKLNYKLSESKFTEPDTKFTTLNIPIFSGDLSKEIPFLWDLNKLDISPDDKYEFYFEVFDNDKVTGPKSSKTRILSLRLPSLKELAKNTETEHRNIEKELEETLKKADEVKKNIEELQRDIDKNKNKKPLDWKEKKKADDIAKKQEEIKQQMEEVQQKLENLTKSLKENKMISQETLQKYFELQKLMSEINNPEFKKMQERMNQALNQLSPEQMQKAMQQYQFNEEQFRKSIERTMKIMKRLKAEQKIDALTKRTEELIKRQEELEKQTSNTNPSDNQKKNDLINKQKNIANELDDIAKEMKDIENIMKEIGQEMPLDQLNKANEELSYSETSKEMQDAQKSIQNNNMSKAQNAQKNASNKMKNFAQQLKKLKQEMKNRTNKEAIKKMQKSISDLLKLSQKQESLKQKTANTDYNSTQIPNITKTQSDIYDALASVANDMVALSQKSFSVTPEMGQQIGNALQNMQSSMEKLAERQSYNSVQSMDNAKTSMNKAISQMQSALSQIQNQGQCNNPGGSWAGGEQGQQEGMTGNGFMQKLQQLAAQQQMINQSLQQINNQGSLSQEQQNQLGRLSGEQGRTQKSLEELAREQKKLSGEKKQGLGNLDKIAEEMKEAVKELKNNNISQETMKRQERILSRLLDATKSIHDRDFEKQRESKTGKEYNRNSPNSLKLKDKDAKNQDLRDYLRNIQEGYTKDYELLIKQYFEAIQSND